MKKYDESHIEYKGESNGVHTWISPSGQPYYWHPDWLHIAEEATGSHPKQSIELGEGETATKQHALKAILSHVNDWAKEKLGSNPDIETQARESEINLKK